MINVLLDTTNGAFNYTGKHGGRSALLDVREESGNRELPVTFQPVNLTHKQQQPRVLRENFKRDSVAEKKRASIGKFPQNLNVS